MVLDGLGEVNYLAALVAAIAWFILGAIWYAPPVLGRAWQRSAGVEVPEGGPNPGVFVVTFVAYFVAAVVTAALAVLTGSTTVYDGIGLGVTVGVGYALALIAIGATYERKAEPIMYFLINGIYNVLGLVVVGIIVAVWN
jgi:hypothetical protein